MASAPLTSLASLALLPPLSYQDIVDLARLPLNDGDKTRYPDAMLLAFACHGLLQVLKRRPDVFIGQFGALQEVEANAMLADTFPLPPEYAQLVADYATARAEMVDDEHSNSGRANSFLQLFGSEAQP